MGEYHAHLAWCVHWHRRAQGTLVSARRLTRRPFALAGNDRPRTAIRARPRQLSACVSDGRLPTPATAVRRQPSAHTHGRRPHALARPHRPSTRTGNGRPRTVVRARLRQPSAQSACPASAFRAHRRLRLVSGGKNAIRGKPDSGPRAIWVDTDSGSGERHPVDTDSCQIGGRYIGYPDIRISGWIPPL